MALWVAIAALILAAVALATLQHRYRLIRRRLHMLHISAENTAQANRNLYARLAVEELARAGRSPRMRMEFLSDFGEDILLFELFAGRTEGFYIECGAHDGYYGSVTYPFEAMGWTGLLVEPVPRTNEMCRRNRPHSTVVQAVMSRRGSTGTIQFAEVTTAGRHEMATRSHVLKPGERPKQVTRDDVVTVRDVPVSTMDAALERLTPPPPRIDFAVIDVEGHELDLFDGFDLDRWKPRAIMVEEYPPGRRSELLELLRSRGYREVRTIGWNKLMVRADDAELLRRCAELEWIREAVAA